MVKNYRNVHNCVCAVKLNRKKKSQRKTKETGTRTKYRVFQQQQKKKKRLNKSLKSVADEALTVCQTPPRLTKKKRETQREKQK